MRIKISCIVTFAHLHSYERLESMKRLYENQNREEIDLRKPVRSFLLHFGYVVVSW
ncbi:MAG: hypothetical protein JWO91_1714, partial [Acidobacteriaceae bacterium]|nr:hypothetical protein [Acidobacteriaceae bacterium]